MELGLSPGDFVLDGDPAPLPQRGTALQLSAHFCCGQTAEWIKMTLDTEVGICPGVIVVYGDPSPKKGHLQYPAHFSAHVYCGQTVANLTDCFALVQTVAEK